MIPVRCFTCGKVIGDKWENYKSITENGKTPVNAFEILGLKRYCCKRMILGYVDLHSKMLKYVD